MPKFLITNDQANGMILDSSVRTRGGYIYETWQVGDLLLKIRWPQNSKTPHGRGAALVTGENLGGYIGLSCGRDGYHIGTPSGDGYSSKLVQVMQELGIEQLEEEGI